jgi:prophage regulatory protein
MDQPENDRILVSLNAACRMTSLSRTAINRKRGDGQFPKEVSLGERRIGFVRAEVEGWIQERVAARANTTQAGCAA